jgi:protein-tyrosine phosphatase
MDTQFTRHLPLAGTHNVRDLGGYPAAGGTTRWRRVLRADSLHKLDADGVAALIDEGLLTVIDLRQPQELDSHPNPFASHDGVRYHNVSLFERVIPPMDASDVLLEMYKLALSDRGEALRTILTAIAEAGDEGAVLFHCTAGKDRTGIVAALLLSLAGVDSDTIKADYAMTAALIADPASFQKLLAAEPATMAAFIAHIDDVHGGVEAYLASIGIGAEVQARLRARLVETGEEAA